MWKLLRALLPPLALIFAVLGSILTGFATPTEAAGVGAMGAMILAIRRAAYSRAVAGGHAQHAAISSMVFLILIGASVFSLVFRGYGGDDGVRTILESLPGGVIGAVIVVMLVMFLLGFVLDFIEITFVVVPIVGPVLLAMGLDPVWLGIMIAINLQTSFLTPPFGFALFYLRGVAPPEVTTRTNLSRRHSVCCHSAFRVAVARRFPRPCYVVTEQDLWRLTHRLIGFAGDGGGENNIG